MMAILSIRHAVTRNWFLKLFSILLAVLLWVTIASETNSVIVQTVPLEFRAIPRFMEIIGESATQVSLQLRGSSNLLNEISPADIAAVISLSGETPGEKNVQLTAANILTPFGVEVLRFDPSRVQFTLERTLTRTIPVRHNVEGEPAEDFVVGPIIVVPSTVNIVGPESSIESLDTLPTTVVRIDGADSDVQTSVGLNVLDPLVRLESLSAYEVIVEIHEVEVRDTFTIVIDPSLDPTIWMIEPTEVAVTIRGPKSRMLDIDTSGVFFTVDTAAFTPGTQQVSPEIIGLLDPFAVEAILPESVQVVVRSAIQ